MRLHGLIDRHLETVLVTFCQVQPGPLTALLTCSAAGEVEHRMGVEPAGIR